MELRKHMFSPIKVTSVGVDSDATANVRKRDFVRNNLVFKLFCLIVIVHEMYCALTSLSVFRRFFVFFLGGGLIGPARKTVKWYLQGCMDLDVWRIAYEIRVIGCTGHYW